MSLSPNDYLHPSRGNTVKALALALALLRRAPREAPEGARKALKRLRTAVGDLQQRRRARGRPSAGADSRGVNASLDIAWGVMRDGLVALARLPAHCPSSQAARSLLDRLFPKALTFLSQSNHAVWVESDELLRVIRDESLAGSLTTLLHGDVLAEVERAHKAFGDVIGMTADVAQAAPKVDLAASRDAVYAAVNAYVVQMLAAADDADAETEAAVRHALAPIVEQRIHTRKRAAEEETDEDEAEDEAEGEAEARDGDAPANDDEAPAEEVSRVA